MNLHILLGMVGPWQVVIIIVAMLLLFGGKKIPELMKGLGQGMKEFKKTTSDMKAEMDSEIKDVKEVIEQDKEEK